MCTVGHNTISASEIESLNKQLKAIQEDPWRKCAATVLQIQALNWLSELPIDRDWTRLGSLAWPVDYLSQASRVYYAIVVLMSAKNLGLIPASDVFQDRQILKVDPDVGTLKVSAAFLGVALPQLLCHYFGKPEIATGIGLTATAVAAGYWFYQHMQMQSLFSQGADPI